jgi:hypothetical protein
VILDGLGWLFRLGFGRRRLLRSRFGERGFFKGRRLGAGVERRHIKEMIWREILENLVEGYPDLGSRDRADGLAQFVGQRFDEIFDREFDVPAGELGIDYREGQKGADLLRRGCARPQDLGWKQAKDGQDAQGDPTGRRRWRFGSFFR